MFGPAEAAKVVANTASVTSPSIGNSRYQLCLLLPCNFSNTVTNSANTQAENNNAASLFASPGLALGLGSYHGEIQLRFPSTVPANTWSYVRIGGDADLFRALLGGSLGNLLGTVLGSVLLGRQDIQIQALNSTNTAVLTRSSIQGFNTDRVRLVTDKNGLYYLAIKPAQSYDRLRIQNRSGSVLGIGAEYRLDVFHAVYFTNEDDCTVKPTFTSYTGSGITLDALNLNQVVQNINYAIDDDQDGTFSQLSVGVLGVAGSSEQYIHFSTPVQPGNDVLVSLAIDPTLLNVGLLNNIELVAYSNGAEGKKVAAGSLLNLDLLGLLQAGQFVQFPLRVDSAPIDQIGVRISSLVGVGVLSGNLKISSVTVAPSVPEVNIPPETGVYVICEGTPLTITPQNQSGRVLNWYNDYAGDDFIYQNQSYTIPPNLAPGEYEFFVRSAFQSCGVESLPSNFKVKVEPRPKPENYTIQPSGQASIDEDGKYVYIEGINPVILTPTISVSGPGIFYWYFDATMIDPIANGMVRDGVLYELGPAGRLTLIGLEFRDNINPYRYYVEWVPGTGCPPNSPKEVDLSSIARILNISVARFTGVEQGEGAVKLDWQLSGAAEDEGIILQRSGIDLHFEDLARFAAEEGYAQSYIDMMPAPGNNYYRLVVVDRSGKIKFNSSLVLVKTSLSSKKMFKVFPNKFNTSINISFLKDEELQAQVQFYSGDGKLLHSLDFTFSGYSNNFTILNLANYPSGKYLLQIKSSKNHFNFNLIKE